MISIATIEDAAAASTVLRAVYPDSLSTEVGMRHRIATVPARARSTYLKAEQDGVLVAWGVAMLDWSSTQPTDAFIRLTVSPAHRGMGIGSALWEELDSHLRRIGAGVVRTVSTADQADHHFAQRRGFHLTATDTALAVDPSTLGPPDPLPSTVVVDSMAARADDRAGLYAVALETMQDEPGDHDAGGYTMADWERDTFGNPDFDAELSTVVRVSGSIVGTSLIFADRPTGRALNGGTGVLRTHRGQGLGIAMKRRSLAAAASVGISSVITTNDDSNAPMLAINHRLGYRPFATSKSWRRDPPPATSAR